MKFIKNKKTIFIIVLLISFFYLLYNIIVLLPKNILYKEEITNLQMQISEVSEKNETLKEYVESENVGKYIDKRIREKGYIYDNEIIFYDVG